MTSDRLILFCGAVGVAALAVGCGGSEPTDDGRDTPRIVADLLLRARMDVGLDASSPEPRFTLSPERPLELTDHLELTDGAGRDPETGSCLDPALVVTPGGRLSLSWSVETGGEGLVLVTVSDLRHRGISSPGTHGGLVWDVAPIVGDRLVLDVPASDGIGLFAAAVLPERALHGSGEGAVASAWAAVAPATTVEEQFTTR